MARPKKPVATAFTVKPVPSALLHALKRSGPMSMRALGAELGITYEAVRQQIAELRREGWVAPVSTASFSEAADRKRGPASRLYHLSAAAEHLFPKNYDALSQELVRHVTERFGGAGVREILARMTDERVQRWQPLLESMNVRQRLEALCSLYEDKDAYMEVQWQEDAPALIEHNCPFLNVAREHPAICSVSVNTLERLLGFRVIREQRFQAGDGRCVFRIQLDQPRSPGKGFTLEPSITGS
jgi:predicted ArsR family transcriptional regulator